MVGLSQGGHHLPLNEVLAAEAAGPVQSLVIQSTDVFTLPHEEASLGQFTTTYCDKGGRKRGRNEGYRKGIERREVKENGKRDG